LQVSLGVRQIHHSMSRTVMRYVIQCAGMVLGHSELLERDESMGVALGAFHPAPDYSRVQAVFRLFAEATPETSAQATDEEKLARYYAARDALGLQLAEPSGRVIRTGTIHISDYSVEAGPDAMEVEVMLDDPSFFQPFPRQD
jgi:hypothetical protein